MQASRPDGHPGDSGPDIRTRLPFTGPFTGPFDGTRTALGAAGDDGGVHT